jgi:hypothetical protein
MTSTGRVKAEIESFLKTSTPEVLCISGRWGVGKTHLWRESIREAQKNNNLAIDRYAYVSLFGLNSLDDLRYAIFESTIPRDQIEKGPDYDALKAQVGRLEKFARNAVYLAKGLPFTEGLLGSTKSAFITVRKQIVCIDDLERHGKELDFKDVLGLASFLKEERGCKVALLLNDERLSADSSAAFQEQLEKVVDTRVAYDPTPDEATTTGLTAETAIHDRLRDHCIKLGIKNIRVIRKIEAFATKVAGLLSSNEPETLHQALHTVTLFGWMHYQPLEAPTLEFVRKRNSVRPPPEEPPSKAQKEKEEAWGSLLGSYNLVAIDEFDEVIIESIMAGSIDPAEFSARAADLDKKFVAHRSDNSLSAAWTKYHSSFAAGPDEVLDGIYTATKAGVATISPANLSRTVSVFKELGRTEQAKELIALYIDNRNEPAEFFDLKQSIFGDDARDPDVVAAFSKRLSQLASPRAPKDILIDIGRKNGWNPAEAAAAQDLSVNDFKVLFKSTEGTDLSRLVRGSLMFRNVGGASAALTEMSSRAEQALREIGSESPINSRRVRIHGIDLPK